MQNNDGNVAKELNFIELLRVLGDYRYLLISCIAFGVIVATIIAFTMTPIYRAEMLIAPAEDTAQSASGLSSILSRLGGVPGLSSVGRLGRRDATAQAVVTLSSQSFTRDFIEEQDLLPILFDSRWDADTEQWAVDPDDIPTLSDGFEMLDKQVRQVIEGDAGIVTIAMEWKDPELAADWANQLVRMLNDRLRRKAIEESNQTIEFLNRELDKTKIVELQQAIYFMIENQINARTMANIRDEYAFKVISPAIPPDEDKYVRPKRMFIVVVGFLIGSLSGIFLSFLFFAIERVRQELKA